MSVFKSAVLVAVLSLAACEPPAPNALAAEPATAPAAAPAQVAAAPAPDVAPAPAKPKAKPKKAAPKPVCGDCGVISRIEEVQIEGEGTGMGAVSGAAAGGAIGNQFGKGDGKTAMTVIGVLAGAAAGHMAEKKIREETIQRFTIAMEDGGTRVVERKERNGLGVGMKVRVAGGAIYLRE